jgi:hypothetical protein
MNHVSGLMNKLGLGGTSNDEGKAASKHPDAEVQASTWRDRHRHVRSSASDHLAGAVLTFRAQKSHQRGSETRC